MIYQNNTYTSIELIRGDIRDAPDKFILIGRNPDLKNHYEKRLGKKLRPIKAPIEDFPVEWNRTSDRSLSVLRTTLRPRESSRKRQSEIYRVQYFLQYPLIFQFRAAQEIAMVPISCRAPEVVAGAMIRMIWDLSIAAFLKVESFFPVMMPTRFSIYCDDNFKPFVNVLESGHYAFSRHGILSNNELRLNGLKLHRYLENRRFLFYQSNDTCKKST